MDPKLRDLFDNLLEQVLRQLPGWINNLLDEVPLHVEDYPSDDVLDMMQIDDRDSLCGLYTGIPLTQKLSMLDQGRFPDPNAVTIYREGIMRAAYDRRGRLTEKELLRQIKITVLHELGHHHGLNEDDLTRLGYG